MTDKLNELIALIKGHRVFIQTHNFPDPDAIASAYGLQKLLEKFDIKTTICHHGNVERWATAAMVETFGIEMTADVDIPDMREDDYIITVDSQKGNANILDLPGDEVACIDHHPTFCDADYRFRDIRIVGSCASIIADYYRQSGITPTESVATVLLYGLKVDTLNFTRGVTQFDIDIFAYLFPLSNNAIIRSFQAGSVQYNELEAFVESMHNIEIYGRIAFAFLDFDCTDAFVATVSDFILDLDVVVFAVVYTHRGGGYKFSLRSEIEEQLGAGEVVSTALEGVGSGGGHKSMAGGFALDTNFPADKTEMKKAVRALFLEAINKLTSGRADSI